MLKLLFIVIVIAGGVFIFNSRYLRYTDSAAGCDIKIAPSLLEFSNGNIKRAIKSLKYSSPYDYQNLCSYVTKIDPSISCGGWEGGCYHKTRPDTIFVSTSQRSLAWTVGVIVHETCHVLQGLEGRPFNEDECYEADDRILRAIVQF